MKRALNLFALLLIIADGNVIAIPIIRQTRLQSTRFRVIMIGDTENAQMNRNGQWVLWRGRSQSQYSHDEPLLPLGLDRGSTEPTVNIIGTR